MARALSVAAILLLAPVGGSAIASAGARRSVRMANDWAAVSREPDNRDLLDLAGTPPGGALPSPWMLRAVRGQRAPDSRVEDSGGVRFVRIGGAGRAAWYVHELTDPLKGEAGELAWEWRVPLAPRGADLRAAATDDAALRIFVVFARGLFERTPRTLFYCTGGTEPAMYERASFSSPRLHVLRMGKGLAAATWERLHVDPFADYRRIWQAPPPAIVAIGIMQDTDQTGAATLADLRSLTWRPRRAPAR